ncbi:hypothetical protein EYF80_058193 [Liparis tanakae]|uniref:Uncharacterized protein n=1 Tax=Liparis tanakae TaxID=230148 RepID=A0A4Z2ES60_9TELE|nr:hypothetical protein EYF80_058193 [Liparis tanakae]
MSELACVKALPQIRQTQGFSPVGQELQPVPHLGGGVGEGLVAVVAVVRLLAAVHQLVALQVARRGEELAAHLAAVARLARVPLAVQVEEADLPAAGSEKALLQSRQLKGFSPVWMRMCRLKLPVPKKEEEEDDVRRRRIRGKKEEQEKEKKKKEEEEEEEAEKDDVRRRQIRRRKKKKKKRQKKK